MRCLSNRPFSLLGASHRGCFNSRGSDTGLPDTPRVFVHLRTESWNLFQPHRYRARSGQLLMPRVLLCKPWGGSSFHSSLESEEAKGGRGLLPRDHSQGGEAAASMEALTLGFVPQSFLFQTQNHDH